MTDIDNSEKTFLSTIISQNLPQYVVSDYPLFVEFLEKYFEWLEEENNVYYRLIRQLSYEDIDRTVEPFVNNIFETYASLFPKKITTDRTHFIKTLKELYEAKGTEKAYHYFFKAIYGDSNIDVIYPKDFILKTSNGKWVQPQQRLRITNLNTTSLTWLNRNIRQLNLNGDVIATAVVEDATQYINEKYSYIELTVDSIIGEFIDQGTILYENSNEFEERVLPTFGSVSIENDGLGYPPQTGVSVPFQADSFLFQIRVEETGQTEIPLDISGLILESDIDRIEIDGVSGLTVNFSYDVNTKIITISDSPNILISNQILNVYLPSSSAILYIDSVGDNGEITVAPVIDGGIGYNNQEAFEIEGFGGGISPPDLAIISNGESAKFDVDGYYKNQDGHLSSVDVLQDSYYYQDYSYVIRSSLPFSIYEKDIKNLLHPTGMLLFGEYSWRSCVDLSLTFDVNLYIDQLAIAIGIYSYPNSLEKMKGDHNTLASYNSEDIVYYEGSYYRANDSIPVESPTALPSSDSRWTIIVEELYSRQKNSFGWMHDDFDRLTQFFRTDANGVLYFPDGTDSPPIIDAYSEMDLDMASYFDINDPDNRLGKQVKWNYEYNTVNLIDNADRLHYATQIHWFNLFPETSPPF